MNCTETGKKKSLGTLRNTQSCTTTAKKGRKSEGLQGPRRKRKAKPKFRSKYEAKVAEYLTSIGAEWKYEPEHFYYQPPKAKYTPDCWVKYPDGTEEYLEVKGYFDPRARVKMLLVKEQHPELNLALHFMREGVKLNAKSSTTYKDWADKYAFRVRRFNAK